MRYLFSSSTTPHLLYPLIGLALELRHRGHEVAFATGTSAEAILGCLGLRRIPRGERDGESHRVGTWTNPLAVAIDVKHVEYAVRTFVPDILISDLFSLGANIVGERTGIPLGVMGMAAYLCPRRDGRAPGFVGWERRAYPKILDALDEARALFGLPPRPTQCDGVRPLGDVFLLRSVAELERQPDLTAGCNSSLSEVQRSAVWSQLCGLMAAEWGCALYVHHGRTYDDPSFWRSWSRRWSCIRYGSTSPYLDGAWIAVLAYSHRNAQFGTTLRGASPCRTQMSVPEVIRVSAPTPLTPHGPA